MRQKVQTAVAEAVAVPINTTLPAIHCYCGLTRLIPHQIAPGDTVTLDPCPKCGSGFSGIVNNNGDIDV